MSNQLCLIFFLNFILFFPKFSFCVLCVLYITIFNFFSLNSTLLPAFFTTQKWVLLIHIYVNIKIYLSCFVKDDHRNSCCCFQTYTQGPVTQQSLLCRAGYESNSRKSKKSTHNQVKTQMLRLTVLIVFSLFLSVVVMLKTPPDLHSVLEKDRHEPSTQLQHETDFHSGSYTPKVQLPYSCSPGHVPRKIEIER